MKPRLEIAWLLLLARPTLLFPAPPPPNIVLITIDTLRADHLHCYGYDQIRTPNIDRLAAEGIRFSTVFTAAPLTLPAHCSIMTGAYPMSHGVRDNVGYRLDPSYETLAQILKRHGYRTGAFVGSYVLDRRFGLGTGFDFYYDHFEEQVDPRETINLAQLKRPGAEVIDHAVTWIKSANDRPFFVWAHLYDPHDPYDPPAPFKKEYAARPYDGEIAYADQQVGRLIAFLNERGLYANTLVVLTADHGESLGEHRELRHGYFIYDATLRVPLIVKPTVGSIKPGVVKQQVRSIDIAPTVLKLLGLPPGKNNQGSDLVGLMSGKQREVEPGIYSESYYPTQFGWSALRSLRAGNLKYIDAPHPELYELDQDPKELDNRAPQRQAVMTEMRSQLLALELAASAPGSKTKSSYIPTPEQMEKLASLGYIGNPRRAEDSVSDSKPKPDPKDMIDIFYLINRAGVEASADHCGEAVPDLLEVIQKAPNIEAAYLMLGRCYFIQENFDDSRKVFVQLQAMDPDNQDALFYTAACQFSLGDLKSAEAGLKKALAANPKRTYAHKYLGFTYQAENMPELAIQEFEAVLETSPNDLESHGKLGFLLAGLSRFQEALSHFEKVVALSPLDPLAHYNLGLAYEKLGDKQKTVRELAAACRLDRQLCGK